MSGKVSGRMVVITPTVNSLPRGFGHFFLISIIVNRFVDDGVISQDDSASCH